MTKHIHIYTDSSTRDAVPRGASNNLPEKEWVTPDNKKFNSQSAAKNIRRNKLCQFQEKWKSLAGGIARIDIFRRGMRGLFGNEMVPYMYLGFDGKNWSEWSV